MKGKESSKKIVIRGVIVVVSAIILLIAIDLLNVLAFNGKPMFLISENDTKQSSILYDIYDCNGKRVYKFKGTKFRQLLGLKSTDIEITNDSKNVYIKTKGYGHGVGMSQLGSNVMAKKGYKYEDILKYYYTGVKIVNN